MLDYACLESSGDDTLENTEYVHIWSFSPPLLFWLSSNQSKDPCCLLTAVVSDEWPDAFVMPLYAYE